MKIQIVFLLIVLKFSCLAQDADNVNKSYKFNHNFEVSVGAAKKQFSTSLGWVHLHGIGKNKKLKIGYGLRFNSFFGNDLKLYYSTCKAYPSTDRR